MRAAENVAAVMSGILAFGDSILKGVSYMNGKYSVDPGRFTALLEQRRNLRIVNRAQMGSTVSRLEKAMSRAKNELSDPKLDTVFLSYGGNDCDFDWQSVSEAPAETHVCHTPYDAFLREYTSGINTLKALGKRVFLLSLPPIDAEKYFRFITRGRNAENVLRWLQGDVSRLSRWHEMYNLAVFKIGKAVDAAVLDITSCFLAKPNLADLLCADGIHPNTEGHRLIADSIAAQRSIALMRAWP